MSSFLRNRSPIAALLAVGTHALLLLLLGIPLGLKAQTAAPSTDIADKSIEELMNIDVTSVSRKDQKLSKIPAAVYVITREMIERSGANIIPDLLRMVPGVQVAQVEANRWAISVRGFNDIYSNKVLVLVDGRTVYTPSFSGVYWDQLDIPLNTIERIEVVRGPGGTVWGANAVNGVISIITRNSQDTKGALVSAGAGSQQTADYLAQYGGAIGGAAAYRAFGHYSSFGTLRTPRGFSGNDGWSMRHGGFRSDWNPSGKDSFMAEGSLFQTDGGQMLPGVSLSPAKLTNSGGDILASWTHKNSDRSDGVLQVYDTYYSRLDSGIREKLNTFDLDYKRHTAVGSRNDIVWGVGYRYTSDSLRPSDGVLGTLPILGVSVTFNPPAKNYSLFSAFIQDEIRLAENLSLTVGTKVEHNGFTGFEYEPSARLAWSLPNAQTLWLAASKAVRQPSRYDTALDVALPLIPVGPGMFLNQQTWGDPNFRTETLRDYEVGYRISLGSRILLDLTGFYSFYGNLESVELVTPQVTFTPGGILVSSALQYGNSLSAQNYGAESSVTWNAASRWKLAGSYSWLKANVYGPSVESSIRQLSSQDPLISQLVGSGAVQGILNSSDTFTNNLAEGSLPRHQFTVQSYLDLTTKLSFDNSLYFVDTLPARGVPAYARFDSMLGWKIRRGITASLVGQNLLSPHHVEFGNVEQATATETTRSIFGKVVWSF